MFALNFIQVLNSAFPNPNKLNLAQNKTYLSQGGVGHTFWETVYVSKMKPKNLSVAHSGSASPALEHTFSTTS